MTSISDRSYGAHRFHVFVSPNSQNIFVPSIYDNQAVETRPRVGLEEFFLPMNALM
ncbi:hypothetical protein ACL1CN_12785 [Corynebacterium striatum]|nr:hypothetical protein [Corynebacterium striatum]HAT1199967.1 hypothetical protein [Corynebacterium striatum]HAT1212434.1 hypothetical protein [Corynebacterium striatum]HAT1282656.1 hypothetical protein [Corynebacterium striatum]HAT1341857.1 hypothetical protein [Corynebacterium striatum]